MASSSMMNEHSQPIEIDAGQNARALTFTANEECLVSGDEEVRLWRVKDGKHVARMETRNLVFSLAASKNGKWIAAGTKREMLVWNAETFEQVLKHEEGASVRGIDFSPDSTRLVAGTDKKRAIVWDLAIGKQVQILRHERHVIAAKYSPRGDRIATATKFGPAQVWDSNDGRLLVDIDVVTPWYNTGLLWSDDHLFVVSDGKTKEFDASTGSKLSEWPVPDTNSESCVALPNHKQFIAFSAKSAITFWDTSTHNQLPFALQHPEHISSIAFSPDDWILAIAGGGKITVQSLSAIMPRHLVPLSLLHPTFREPDVQIDDTALNLWKHDHLENAEASLTASINQSQNPSHHLLASRALVRARLQTWDAALLDAEMALKIEPSLIAYIAKSLAHVGNGERDKGYRACDIAFERFHSSHVTFLLLIKAIVVFMAGERLDAIARLDDLIATVSHNSICYVVQAYMYLLLGNSRMESSDYEGAIKSFELARAQLRPFPSQSLVVVALALGWKFEHLDILVRQRHSEALYLAGCRMDAGESFLELVDTYEEKVYTNGTVVEWISDFTHRYLSTPESDDHNLLTPHTDPTPILREWAKATLASRSWRDALVTAANFIAPRWVVYHTICERLEATACITDATACFQEMMGELGEEVYTSGFTTEWFCDFMQRRLSAPNANDGAVSATHPAPLLREWAKAKLTNSTWKDALDLAVSFTLPRATVYQAIVECLEVTDRIADAVECFHQMTSELGEKIDFKWVLDFRQRAAERPEDLGDAAAAAQRYDEAISLYTTALSLKPRSPQGILVKRNKMYMTVGSWERALDDANQVIELDPSSLWGYERKHAALHKAGDYDSAISAFQEMLSKMEQSADPDIRQRHEQYKTLRVRERICQVVKETTRNSPLELIDTSTGKIHGRDEQIAMFESSPICKELLSSMTTHVDRARIRHVVQQYFQYVVLSHRWEVNEPSFQEVMQITVYDLGKSPTHDKLQTYCKFASNAGFRWAWSDTVCINQSDQSVLQKSLVAMFRWYQGAALMIVFLRGVSSSSPPGALAGSIWNTRGWTLQEYIAAKKIHFYTEDWTPYLNLPLSNHKELSEVVLEMERATGISAEQLKALRPGLSNIREKLRLASTRETKELEDAAYSLIGIFEAASLLANYGEGETSLGRLLANVLTRSGDVDILAWTGESNKFNSCLPARVKVYNGPATSHVPTPIPHAEMEHLITALQPPSFNLGLALRLYDRLNDLSTPQFAESRMTLPCIAFRLPAFTAYRRGYRVNAGPFGMLEVRTRNNLSHWRSLYLVHPWLDALLDHEDAEDHEMPLPSPYPDDDEIEDDEGKDDDEIEDDEGKDDDASLSPEPEFPSHAMPTHMAPVDREIGARRLAVRLRQPFGALLFAPKVEARRIVGYQRVAADALISVRFGEDVSLADILNNLHTLNVL